MGSEVVIKGIAEGLLLYLPDLPEEEALRALADHMEENKSFFEGGNCPVFIAGDVGEATLGAVQAMLGERYGLRAERRAAPSLEKIAREKPAKAGGLTEREGYALTIEGTVRNGQKITYQGDLIVIGDANPGSQLIAGGNILVCGALRGVAHAGALGDEGASIVAFQLLPTQIRIARHIARSPEGMKKPDFPEIARVRDGRIEIAQYLPAKAQGGGFR